jgi:hypothetical protein
LKEKIEVEGIENFGELIFFMIKNSPNIKEFKN